MYPFFGVILLIFLLFMLLHFYRKKCIIKKLNAMSSIEKCQKLNALINPLGYYYDKGQDVFGSTLDAWQRSFGYCSTYDKMAPHFQMIFDCLPVYFDYNGRTWLIEFWKGQYGINTGAEIGIYYADSYVKPARRSTELFKAVSDIELLPLSLRLRHKNRPLACFSKNHWWLTAFCMGLYSNPKDLSMDIQITFPEPMMLQAFLEGLSETAQSPDSINVCGTTLCFTFSLCSSCSCGFFRGLYLNLVQWKNRLFCRLFLSMTKPFVLSRDRVLYLASYAPFAFRRMFALSHYKILRKKRM